MGESLSIEGQECVCITGAVQIKEVEENAGEIKILPGILEEARRSAKLIFRKRYSRVVPDRSRQADDIVRQHGEDP